MAEHNLTKVVGDCGKFHVALVTATSAAYAMVAWVLVFMVFGLYNPGWICLDDGESFNATSHLNETTKYAGFLTVSSRNQTEDIVTVWSKDCAVKQKCQNLMYNPESSTVVTEWDLTCDLDWVPSVIITIQMAGSLVGAYLAGTLGEMFGRKFSLYIHVGAHAVGQLIIAFSSSWQMYAAFMFLIGMSSGGVLASSYHYPMEFVNNWWRGVLTSVPVWNIGCMLFSLAVFILRDWRYAHISGAVGAALVFLTVFWTPDSVRWLAVTGKVEKAKSVVAKISRMNGRKCPDTKIIDDLAEEEASQMGSHKYGYLDLFRTKEIGLYSVIFGFIWVVLAISYYVISFGIKSLSGNFYLNFFLFSIFDFPTMITVGPMVTKLGRKNASLVYFILTSASSFCTVGVFFLASEGVRSFAILILAIMAKSFTFGAWYAVKLFSAELFPTVVRSLHYGYVNAIARIGAMLAPYILSNDPDSLYSPFLAIGILFLIVCGLLVTIPETKGRQLEDRVNVRRNNKDTLIEKL